MNSIIENVENIHLYETGTGDKVLRFVSEDGIASVYLTEDTLRRLAEITRAYLALSVEEV
jgi:hypothetical protein